MNGIDWFQELSFFALMLGSAFIGSYIGLRLIKPSSSVKLLQRSGEISSSIQAFITFASMFIGATVVEDAYRLFSSWNMSPIRKYSASLTVAFVIYIYNRFQRR